MEADKIKKGVQRITWIGFWLNAALAGMKIVAGTLGNSRAVVADGIHSLTDLVSDIAVLIGVNVWSAPADEDHPYGHQRFETAVTLIIGLMMLVAALGIAWDALQIWRSGEIRDTGLIALAAAITSLVVKEALFRWTLREGRRLGSSAVVANAWHHRSDAISSLPAAMAVIGAMLLPGMGWIDLVGAGIIALFLLHAAIKICLPAFNEFLDRGADAETLAELKDLALQVEGVHGIHRLRTRYHGGLMIDLHLTVDGRLSVLEGHAIADAVEHTLLQQGPNVREVLIHVDPCEQSQREAKAPPAAQG
ncbi:cation diffusion facilitator family transporter [Ferrimonas marina]|uniref:Cation diffusion facilitator family transporter n=1 Tax=Ferrimonas marina TaxID=299255 RepID=A0A1M5X4N8_9GAMM|nr:cation diffusion facilitator family transporter [Ferrimonas marina]SHH94830.1 cation diffusion facilitator family transporter [Ferrimonas marina]